MGVVISSGHSKYVRGASDELDEVNEARRVVDRLAELLLSRNVQVATYHDDVSKSQNENLSRICSFHNSQERDLDVSVHFNAYVECSGPMGMEVLYVTQDKLAEKMAYAVSEAGEFKNRGAKYRDDLYFLNDTEKPAILIEICFVDSEADAALFRKNFDDICQSIATVLMEHLA